MPVSAEDIIGFWFKEIDKSNWFNSTPEFDAYLRERFQGVVRDALNDRLDSWKETPDGSLALVVVLDQFPLNMYRGEAQSFAGESKSREVARNAIDQNFDQSLTDDKKAFLYMPFMHSENIKDQNLSVTLFEKAGLEKNLRFAEHHREIIKRYGRFPHRNKIIGRESSADEIAYLNSGKAFLG
jgi:uncharacterized protein (DUF924 family)